MKRLKVILVLVLVLALAMATTDALASDGTLSQRNSANSYSLRVVRPHVRLMTGKGDGRLLAQLDFGTEVQLLLHDGDYCLVTEPNSGATGYIATMYLVKALEVIWITEEGVSLSPRPGMTSWDYGYGAGGTRMNEMALVLFEDSGGYYWYIVTENGFSGYIYRYDPAIRFLLL